MSFREDDDLIKSLDQFIQAATVEVPQTLMPGALLASNLAGRIEELKTPLGTAVVGLAMLLIFSLSAAIRDLEQSIDRHSASLKVQ